MNERPLSSLQKEERLGLRRKGYVARCLELGIFDPTTNMVTFSQDAWVKIRQENWNPGATYQGPRAVSHPYPMPGMLQQAKNALGAAGRVVRNIFQGKKVLRTEEDTKRIIEICKACEFLRQSNGRCTKCGCTVISDIFSKASLTTEVCPIGRWK
jgi:hypothetical protein